MVNLGGFFIVVLRCEVKVRSGVVWDSFGVFGGGGGEWFFV